MSIADEWTQRNGSFTDHIQEEVAMSGRITLCTASALLAIAIPGHGAIVINEVLANPDAVTDANGEWVELFNPAGANIDLTGWTLADANESVDLSGLVAPAHGFLLLGRVGDSNQNGGVTLDFAYGSTLALTNSSNSLVLTDAGASVVDEMSYTSAAAGISLERIDPAVAGTDAGNWVPATTQWAAPSSDFGTPGSANSNLAAVPEPSTLVLTLPLLVAAGAWQRRRRR
jgi:hypothetical protein